MSDVPFRAIDHVQLAMPVGEEAAARKFYCELLGMAEMPKPAELAKRGGAWFVSGACNFISESKRISAQPEKHTLH
jgi:hypothetical protein